MFRNSLKKSGKTTSFFLFILFFFTGLICCKNHAEGGSVTTLLDTTDTLIAQGDTKAALDVLKAAQKTARTTYENVGIYKRYVILGEEKSAEKILKNAIKKEKDNIQLIAVYAHFLAKHGRSKEALAVASRLSGTAYASLYAEAFLRTAVESNLTADELFNARQKRNKKIADETRALLLRERFYDERFIPIYQDAFYGSKISLWAKNAASLSMAHGRYEEAAALYPAYIDQLADSLFWASVFYDAGRFSQSLDALLKPTASQKREAPFSTLLEHQALLADVYYILGEDDISERLREELMAQIEGYTSVQSVQPLLALLYINSALYARSKEDFQSEYTYLHTVLSLFPQYEPALAAYGEFALYQTRRPPDDKMTAHIRSAGLLTHQMEKEAQIPEVSVDDVLDLIQQARAVRSTPNLIVLEEELRLSKQSRVEKSQKVSKLWALLENNEITSAVYPEEIIRYAVSKLLEADALEEAENLFTRYLQASRGRTAEGAEPFIPVTHTAGLSLWECEVLAWFSVQKNALSDALVYYQSIVDRYASRSPVSNASGQNAAVLASYINMGTMYAGLSQAPLALDCFTKASARATDATIKAEILYRMGKESFYMRDYHTALRSLQYAIKLNPSHNKARLTLQLVQQAQNQ